MPLTSLDHFTTGAVWIPTDEVGRLQSYSANRKLFEAEHDTDETFKKWFDVLRDDHKIAYLIVLNLHKRLSMLWTDLLLGNPPKIRAGEIESVEQVRIDQYVEDGLMMTTREVGIDWSRFGTGLFKIRHTGKKSLIMSQQPDVWFPICDEDDIKIITHHVLAWEIDVGEGRNKRRAVKIEIHSENSIEYRAFYLKDGILGAPVEELVKETVTHNLGEHLIIPVFNVTTSDRVTGFDDYKDIDSIVQELEARFSQIAKILDAHSDPKMAGPQSALEWDPDTKKYVFKAAGGRYFPFEAGEEPPQYIVWDAQLNANFTQIDKLMEQFYIISETSPAAFGQFEQGIANVTGPAFKRLMIAPLAKVNRMMGAFDPALKRALRIAEALNKKQNTENQDLAKLSITWREGLPDDDMEQTTIEATRVAAGLTSQEGAVARTLDLEGKALQDELAKIREEANAKRPIIQDPEADSIIGENNKDDGKNPEDEGGSAGDE